MNKRFRVCSDDEPFLLPPSLQDWLPENHLARLVADVMNELDLSAIYASYERSDGRGLSAYHPVRIARLLLYALEPRARARSSRLHTTTWHFDICLQTSIPTTIPWQHFVKDTWRRWRSYSYKL